MTEHGIRPGSDRTRLLYLATPLTLAVPVLIWLAFRQYGVTTLWAGFGLGALGWNLALVLRAPVGLLLKNVPQEKSKWLMASISGPAEELVRLGVLLLMGSAFSMAASIGQGWAAIEVLFAILNGFLVNALANRTDEKAIMAREQLARQGLLNVNPLWGVVERIFASAGHIGFTLLVAANPWLVLLTLPVHTAVNMTALKLTETRPMIWVQGFLAAFGTLVLAAGLVAHGLL